MDRFAQARLGTTFESLKLAMKQAVRQELLDPMVERDVMRQVRDAFARKTLPEGQRVDG